MVLKEPPGRDPASTASGNPPLTYRTTITVQAA